MFTFPKAFLSICLALALGQGWADSRNDFILVKNGKPNAVFVPNEEGGSKLDAHIQFFNRELQRCTKTALPVVKKADKKQNRIVFRLEKRPLLSEDAFTIDFPDSRTLQITGTETSIRWALNHLLEKEIGIRWLLPPLKDFYGQEINHYPQLNSASVKMKQFSDRPGVPVSRMPDWHILQFSMNWNAKNEIKYTHMVTLDVFPVYKYAVDGSWPQAILPVIKGKKIVLKKAKAPLPSNPWRAARPYKEYWQPCWSSPETVRIAIENILEVLCKDPGKKIINIDVNDNGGCCECDACRKAVAGKRNLSGMPDYSGLYWAWANEVAKGVTAKYPDVIFSALAYREVLAPPPFKLHPNILPRLCLELSSMLDPVWYEKRIRLIKNWSDKAAMLDLYDYPHGIKFFYLPRIYFRSHSRLLSDLIRNYKLRSTYFESDGETAFQGPLQSLKLKLLWDPDLDVEAFLKDWCEHAVGRKAAPYLRQYYQLWEDYWTGEDIRKTAWYNSVGNVYMQLGECNSHTYALKKGDLKKFRSCMEKAIALTETPEQKKRAQVLMQAFEFSEQAAEVAFSEIFPPNGQLDSKVEALELVNAIPASLAVRKKLLKHPLIRFRRDKGKSLFDAADSSIGKIIPYLSDPEIRKRIEKYADDPTIPDSLRAQFKIWLGKKAENLIENGSFELDKPTLTALWSKAKRGERDSRYASDGKYSFRSGNGCYRVRRSIERGKTYLFLCDIYMEKGSGEGRFRTRIGPCIGTTPVSWFRTETIPAGGGWTTCSSVISSDWAGVDNLDIQLHLLNYEPDEQVWIDNLRLYCIDDVISNKKQPEKPEPNESNQGENKMNLKKNKLETVLLAASVAMITNAAEVNVNGDFSKATPGAEHPLRWSENAAAAKGKTVIESGVQDSLPVYRITTNEKRIYSFCKNSIETKSGDTLKITVKASGTGKFMLQFAVFGDNKTPLGRLNTKSFAVKQGMSAYTATVRMKLKKGGEIESALMTLIVQPSSDISFRSIKVENISGK